jgi:hypothetical protein
MVKTIKGLYSYASNPCTTKPCLPGMVYAVLADGTYYYITVQDNFLFENLSYNGYKPELGAPVEVTGYLSSHKDINSITFFKIELISLKPAK